MDVRLPRLGEGADSGTVASIFVKEGDQVVKDQPILELESEKAVATIPSTESGVVSKVHVKEGDAIKVGQKILTITPAEGKAAAAPAVIDVPVSDEEEALEPPVTPEGDGAQAEEAGPAAAPGIPPPASPTIRRLARELGIDLRAVRGSERGGRIVMADLRKHIQRLRELSQARPQMRPETAAAPAADFAKWGPVERVKLTTLRKAIRSKMSESWATAPRVTQFDEVDVTAILALKKKHEAAYEARGGRLTLTVFALRSVSLVLAKHPLVNASLDDAAGEIILKKYYNIGMAVDTEQGLIVPVIRDVDKKSMLQLAVDVQDLAERTRKRQLALEEMQGGTFSISNQGGIGSGHFTPIINVPEVAILGMGRGTLKPVIRDGKVVPRTMMPVTLSYDHRVIDGANAARFMVDLVASLEAFDEAHVLQGI